MEPEERVPLKGVSSRHDCFLGLMFTCRKNKPKPSQTARKSSISSAGNPNAHRTAANFGSKIQTEPIHAVTTQGSSHPTTPPSLFLVPIRQNNSPLLPASAKCRAQRQGTAAMAALKLTKSTRPSRCSCPSLARHGSELWDLFPWAFAGPTSLGFGGDAFKVACYMLVDKFGSLGVGKDRL